jgi:23S rRNA (cytosine1962-C5)-methyltransferase
MSHTFPQIALSSGKDQSLRRFHPWVFSGAIKKVKNKAKLKDGDIVEVFDKNDEFLGT